MGDRRGPGARARDDHRITARRREVAALRAQGLTQEEVAARLGVGQSTVSDDCQALLDAWRDAAERDLRVWLAEELATLALMQAPLMAQVLDPDGPHHRAVEGVLRIMARRARLLGVDAAERQDEPPLTMERLNREIARLEGELLRHGEELPP